MEDSPKVKRILVATDFLESSRLALEYAEALARHFEASIVLLHALELGYAAEEVEAETSRPSMTRRAAHERLETIAQGVRSSRVAVEILLVSGIPSDVILDAVVTQKADLLVLGIHGIHRGLVHLLVGSNAEKILLSATCPTMTVGAHVMTGVNPGLHFKEILLFSDQGPSTSAASAYASFLSEEFDAPIDICELTLKESASEEAVAEVVCGPAEAMPGQTRGKDKLPDLHVDRELETGAIIDRARSHHAGFVVLGIHSEASLRRHLHSSLAYRLLAEATCPVISVRSSVNKAH